MVSLGFFPLVGLDGAPSGVNAVFSFDVAGGSGGTGTGDTQALLGDNMLDCVDPDVWSVQIAGLLDGDYLLHVYAPSNPLVDTGNMTANGVAIASMPGSNTSTLIEGTSWDSAAVTVTGGTLAIAATSPGAVNCIGLSGFQLAGPIPPVVPALGSRTGAAALLALGAAAMLAAALRVSSVRH
jgi:hypothetical protein